jgi:hypothetical protein
MCTNRGHYGLSKQKILDTRYLYRDGRKSSIGIDRVVMVYEESMAAR